MIIVLLVMLVFGCFCIWVAIKEQDLVHDTIDTIRARGPVRVRIDTIATENKDYKPVIVSDLELFERAKRGLKKIKACEATEKSLRLSYKKMKNDRSKFKRSFGRGR